jgi:hypothetical protein
MSRNLKYTCGQILPSGCVIYTGEFPDFIDEEELDCDLNLDEVLKLHGEKIDLLLAGNDFTQLDKKCLDFTPATVTAKQLHQVEINKICDLADQLEDLEALLTGLNIGAQLITIDLDCLTPVASPCAQGVNTYTLLSILQIFRAEICAIKDHLNL